MATLVNKTKETFGQTREAVAAVLEQGYRFPGEKLGQPFFQPAGSLLGLVWFLTFALTSNSLSLNPAAELQSLLPGGAWVLVNSLNLGMLRDMVFKVVVIGGLIAQNRSRLVMLLAMAIVVAFKLLRRAAPHTAGTAAKPASAPAAARSGLEPCLPLAALDCSSSPGTPPVWRLALCACPA